MSDARQARFEELVEDAAADPGVIGLFVFGSRSRDGFADEASDYDVAVVVNDDRTLTTFDQRWPHSHGSSVEVVTATLAEFKQHAELGSTSEWARYQYAHLTPILDKTGEIETTLRAKERIPKEVHRDYTASALGGYINSTYRSMRAQMLHLQRAARLDAAESVPYFLTAVFALEERVRPFNKYLEWELTQHPLNEPVWSSANLLPLIDRVTSGDLAAQQELFRDLERESRAHGFGDVVDDWQPDVEWLRGEGAYRSTR